MSALELKRIGGGRKCSVPLCNNGGRFVYYLIGHPSADGYGREMICGKHGKEWLRLVADLAPSRERFEDLVADIGGNATERCDAINDLRELGFSPDHIALAVKGIAEQVEPPQILDRMLGVVELEAVA